MDQAERQYTLQELADHAGVSVRTIRYYIGEGLLPAPVGAGPQSHYTESHAKRLRAIALMKDRFLPLREIRRALAGLDDQEIDRLIDDLGGNDHFASPMFAPEAAMIAEEREPLYDAMLYIDSVLPEAEARAPRRRTPPRTREPVRDDGESWQRITIGDGIELLVRDDVWQRRREQLRAVIEWARRVGD